MANSEHTSKFKGVDAWNRWRQKNPAINVDLRRLNFTRANLSGANFSNADLTESNLHETNLNRVNFSGANLRGANLSGANFRTADFSGANLSGVNLSGMNLSGVNLSGANLAGVNLRVANLRGANLSAADLRRTDLSEADLREANLRAASLNDAYLIRTDLSGADLSEANLSQVGLYETAFVDANLSGASGMDTCAHIGPSKIDHRAIIKSGNLSLNFLRGCGVPETLITYLPSLLNDAIQFYSCFISYSAKDQNFADRLHADLQNKGVRCWFAPHDIQAGKKIHEQIDDAIRIHDRLLLILSTASIGSEWVQTEIAKARRREIREKRRMLFPVRLVDFETLREWECFDADTGKDSAREIREYFVPDFSNWKNHDAYQQAFAGLLRDLKAQQSASKNVS